MNKLYKAVADYITMRRQLGCKLINEARVLKRFIAFMTKKKKITVKTKLALEFVAQRTNLNNSRWPTAMIGIIRRFAVYLHAIDPKTEIPPTHLLPNNYSRRTPYIFSEDEIMRLLGAASNSAEKYGFVDTFHTLFGLIAVTGMRTSEAISLNDDCIDLSEGIIEIRQTKFQKSRKIPLHASTNDVLKKYMKDRNEHYPVPKVPAFFLGIRGGRLDRTIVERTFRKMCVTAKVFAEGHLEPRIIDLRHTFAARNLLRCYQENLDVDRTIATLSIYLGHENPEYTYWYLTSTPELLNLINQRAEKIYWRK
jgi:integrase/recombinase XerD